MPIASLNKGEYLITIDLVALWALGATGETVDLPIDTGCAVVRIDGTIVGGNCLATPVADEVNLYVIGSLVNNYGNVVNGLDNNDVAFAEGSNVSDYDASNAWFFITSGTDGAITWNIVTIASTNGLRAVIADKLRLKFINYNAAWSEWDAGTLYLKCKTWPLGIAGIATAGRI